MKNNSEENLNIKLVIMMNRERVDRLKAHAAKQERTVSQIVRKLVDIELENENSKLFK